MIEGSLKIRKGKIMNNTQKNYFHQQADFCRDLATREDEDGEALLKEARLYDLLGDMVEIEPNAAQFVMNTGALNDEMKAYCCLACRRAGLSPKQTQEVRNEMHFLFDDYLAGEALEAWEKKKAEDFRADL